MCRRAGEGCVSQRICEMTLGLLCKGIPCFLQLVEAASTLSISVHRTATQSYWACVQRHRTATQCAGSFELNQILDSCGSALRPN